MRAGAWTAPDAMCWQPSRQAHGQLFAAPGGAQSEDAKPGPENGKTRGGEGREAQPGPWRIGAAVPNASWFRCSAADMLALKTAARQVSGGRVFPRTEHWSGPSLRAHSLCVHTAPTLTSASHASHASCMRGAAHARARRATHLTACLRTSTPCSHTTPPGSRAAASPCRCRSSAHGQRQRRCNRCHLIPVLGLVGLRRKPAHAELDTHRA